MALCEHKPYYIDGINMKYSINVPSKFGVLEKKNPCKFLTYRTLTFGCPDGLEPSTFRTTSNLSISPIVPLFIDVCDFIENRVCVDYTPFCLAKGRNMRRFFERQRLVSQTKHKKFNTKYRTMTIAYYQSG